MAKCQKCFKEGAGECEVPYAPTGDMICLRLCKGCRFEISAIFQFIEYAEEELNAPHKAGQAHRDALNQPVGASNRIAGSGGDVVAATPPIGAGPRTPKKGPKTDKVIPEGVTGYDRA